MHIGAINNFNVSNGYNFKNNNVKNNQDMRMMKSAMNADTVSFGADKKKNHSVSSKMRAVAAAAMMATTPVAVAPITSCEREPYAWVYSNVDIDINIYPYIIDDGGRFDYDSIIHDTIYIPADTIYEMNDTLIDIIDDFDIDTTGTGDFVDAFTLTHEYLNADYPHKFNAAFSTQKRSSFTGVIMDKETSAAIPSRWDMSATNDGGIFLRHYTSSNPEATERDIEYDWDLHSSCVAYRKGSRIEVYDQHHTRKIADVFKDPDGEIVLRRYIESEDGNLRYWETRLLNPKAHLREQNKIND